MYKDIKREKKSLLIEQRKIGFRESRTGSLHVHVGDAVGFLVGRFVPGGDGR